MEDSGNESPSLVYSTEPGYINFSKDRRRITTPSPSVLGSRTAGIGANYNNNNDSDNEIDNDDSDVNLETTGLLNRSQRYLQASKSPDSDYKSDRSPLFQDGDTPTSYMSRDQSVDHESGLSESQNSGPFFYRGKNERLHTQGSCWPLAEGNGWVPSGLNSEESSLHQSCIGNGNYNSISQSSREQNSTNDEADTEKQSEKEDEEKSFKFSTLTRNQKVILASTSLTNLLSFWSLSILAPFFPIEADKKDVNTTISGWIFGVFALVQFLTSPIFGRLLPIVGSKFMYLSGIFMVGGCTLCFGLLDRIDTREGILVFVLMCFVTRILLALGSTAINNAGFVLLVRAFPNNVATVFGIGEIFTGLGMVTGPALGGFLYDAGGFLLPFAIIGVSCLVLLPLIGYSLPYQDDSQEKESADLSLWKVVATPKSIINSITVVMAASIWAVLDPTLEPHLRVAQSQKPNRSPTTPDTVTIKVVMAVSIWAVLGPTLEPHLRVYNLGPSIVGVLFLIMAAFYSVTSPVWGWIADKLGDNRALLIPGFILAAVGLLLAGPSPALGFELTYNELWLTIISLVILGVASAMVVIPTYDIYIEILGDVGYPEDTRTYGMVSGLWCSMYALGDFAGPSLGGFLDQEIGFEWLTTWFAAACVLTGILIAISWFIEVKCCKKQLPPTDDSTAHKTLDGAMKDDERTPLLTSSVDADILRTYPPKSDSEYSFT